MFPGHLDYYKNHFLEVGLTQNREIMALRTLTTVDLFDFYHVCIHTRRKLVHYNHRCDLAIAIHARKMYKKIFVVVHPEVLNND